jgi:hypothetical protein
MGPAFGMAPSARKQVLVASTLFTTRSRGVATADAADATAATARSATAAADPGNAARAATWSAAAGGTTWDAAAAAIGSTAPGGSPRCGRRKRYRSGCRAGAAAWRIATAATSDREDQRRRSTENRKRRPRLSSHMSGVTRCYIRANNTKPDAGLCVSRPPTRRWPTSRLRWAMVDSAGSGAWRAPDLAVKPGNAAGQGGDVNAVSAAGSRCVRCC